MLLAVEELSKVTLQCYVSMTDWAWPATCCVPFSTTWSESKSVCFTVSAAANC